MPARKTKFADVPAGADNPLNAAVTGRDRGVHQMVRRALDAGDVMLAYQPVMQARAPHGLAFYEGLIRVLDETGRVIPAGQFIHAAEESELGRLLDCQSLKMGLKALSIRADLRLSLNMSARSIGYPRWRQILTRFLQRDASIAERLILEISGRSAMLVPEIVAGFMADMQTHGLCFALDDFGADPISVRYLKDFYFDAVKIDAQFTRGVNTNPDAQVIAAALVSMARPFDMFVVAGGIEDQTDAAWLSRLGVDCLQGYLFGAPSVRPPWLVDNAHSAAG